MSLEPTLSRLGLGLLHWLVPARCLSCKSAVDALPAPLGLCPACRSRLAPLLLEGVCAVCAEPLARASGADEGRCHTCLARPPSFDRLLAAWHYLPPLDAVVRDFKFRRLDYLGSHLARTMADRLGPAIGEHAAPPVLVSHVPLHWRRRFVRGYDQAREIAVPLARALALPFVPVLRRRRATPAQSSLDRSERLANLSEVFRVRAPVAGRCILLVDDVATTGATLDAAARALKERGAHKVFGLVAARTPRLGAPGRS